MAIPAPSDGEVFGHYRLVEQIGAGGMGVVWRAYDERLHRDVALKILPPGLFADEAARRQFRNEALTVGKLSHPNIAMAFDFGHENGVDYLVTEFVPGINLDEKIAQQPLPQKSVVEWGMQLASGLDAAHRAGVIHRDLKPGNLRLTPDGHLKILDFGLARQIVPVDDTEDTINIETEPPMSGTLPYMAPEILRGDLADVRTDIWAAGAVLYEMATGKRAYPDRQHTLLVDAILHYDPVRPCLLNPKLSAALEAVILKALDRDPERRYQSARELRVDLARIAAGENPTDTIHRTAVLEVAAKSRRRKALLGLAVVLVVGIAIGYLITHWPPPPPPPATQKILAVLPFDTVGQDPATSALGAGLAETLTAKLVQASDSDSIQVVSPRDLRDQGVKTAEDARREFGTDMVLESSLQRQGDAIRINCSLVDSKTRRQIAARTVTGDASDSFGLQDKVVNEVVDILPARLNPKQRSNLNVRQDTQPAAYEAYIRGRGYLQEYEKPENIDSAIAEFQQALKIDPNYALAYAALGNAYWTGYRQFPKSGDWIAKALVACDKALSLNPELVEGHVCLGNALTGTGKYARASQEFQRAVQTEPNNEEALRGLADAYASLGKLEAAEASYKNAIALRPNYWGVYSWLGYFYCSHARYLDCAEMFLKVTQLSPQNYHGYLMLGAAYVNQGRYTDAIAAFGNSIDRFPTSDAYGNLGYTYTLMHRFPEAIKALEQTLRLSDKDYLDWGNLADALYWSSNRRSEANEKYRKAINMAQAKLEINPNDIETLAYLADYSAMVDDREGAFRYLEVAQRSAPPEGEILFRTAVVYNHFGQTSEALDYLGKAAVAGYSRSIIRDTPDFTPLHQQQAFRAIVDAK